MRGPSSGIVRAHVAAAFIAAALAAGLVSSPRPAQAQNDINMYDPTVQRGSIFFPRFRPVEPQRQPRARQQSMRDPRAPVRRVLDPALGGDPNAPGQRVGPLPKSDPDTFIVVLGDTLADLLASGLDDAFGDQPKTVVVRRTKPDSGLVRVDHHDWAKAAREIAAGDQRVSVAVMLVGSNDRQPIREGEVTHEPLGERWREIYRERIDAVAAAFRERRIPLVWVGAPPMQNSRLSTDMIALNELYRQRVERAGGVFVDLWSGFVDGENRFSPFGPDLNGQVARLRTNDGVHFTRAGARKAAHFTDVALRRILPDLSAGPVLAAPAAPAAPELLPPAAPEPLPLELQPGGVERAIDQMARAATGLEPVAAPIIVVKPAVGPVTPLTGPALARGGALLPGLPAARGDGGQAAELNRVFNEGRAPAPVAGRADDFRWPRTP